MSQAQDGALTDTRDEVWPFLRFPFGDTDRSCRGLWHSAEVGFGK